MTTTIALDFAYDEDTFEQASLRFAAQFGVTVELVREVGSVGWPEVRLHGDRNLILHALREAWGFGEGVDDINPEDLVEELEDRRPMVSGTPYQQGTTAAVLGRNHRGDDVIDMTFGNVFSENHVPLTPEAANELRNELSKALMQLGL